MFTKIRFEINDEEKEYEFNFNTNNKNEAENRAKYEFEKILKEMEIDLNIFHGNNRPELTILFSDDEDYYKYDKKYDNEEYASYIPVENDEG
ncbi:hypothetical protein [Treponema porcinum]|uniref:hypothetical protein n=1 Tax=Treponema porcinum TaxID=261392 RepID=UPI003F064D0D